MGFSINRSKLIVAIEKSDSRNGVISLSKLISDAINNGTINDSDVAFTDITTGNVSTSKHGFAPKLPNDPAKYLDGTGAYSVPPGTPAWDSVARVSSSDFTTSSLSAVDVTGLTFATQANTQYEFELVVIGQSSSAAGIKFQFAHSGAGASLIGIAQNTGPVDSQKIVLATLSTAEWTTAGSDAIITAKGFLIVGANAGTFSFQVQKITSGSLTVYKGSNLKVIARA